MMGLIRWQSPHMIGVALLIGVLVTLAVCLLYPAQTRSLSTFWRWGLAILRVASLGALALSVARPVTDRELTEEERGAFVVVVDKSRSMSVRDQQRTPAMLVSLADGLGKLPPNVRSRNDVFTQIQPDIQRLGGLIDAILQPQNELVVAQLQGRQNPAAQKRLDEAAAEFTRVAKSLADARHALKSRSGLVDALARLERLPSVNSREWPGAATTAVGLIADRAAQFQSETDDALYRANADVRAQADRLGALSRLELAKEALLDPASGLLKRLPRSPVFGYSIGTRALPLPLHSNQQPVRRLLIEPDALRSDISGGLREILEQLRYLPIQAVILLSDGRQVGTESAIASNLAGSSVPIYTISTGPVVGAAAVRDISIEQVDLPSSLFIGETMRVIANVRWSNIKSPPREVILQIGDRSIRAPILEGRKPNVEIQTAVEEAGACKVTLSVPASEGEASTQNNAVTRWVKVLSDKFDVMLVGGSPSWDFRFLRNALLGTQWINSRTVLLDGPDLVLKATPEELSAQDVIILADAPAAALSPAQWEAVRQMVSRRGGSLILMAGQGYLPRTYTSEPTREFLPYRGVTSRQGSGPLWRAWPGEEPEFRIVPAAGAGAASIVALDAEPGISADRWNALPPMFRFLELPELKESVTPLLVERSTGMPVLTQQRLGRGKVFFLGVDETWRWRLKAGERDQEKFFRQLIRNAADEPYGMSNDAISLDVDQITVAPGEKLHVRARLLNPFFESRGSGTLTVDVVRDGATISQVVLAPLGIEGSGRFEGDIAGLEPGEYTIRAIPTIGAELDFPIHVLENHEAEMSNLNVDDEFLKRIATSSGGEFLTLDRVKALPDRLIQLRQHQTRFAEVRLWNSWYLYSFVLSCLGLEWALRKKLGMA